MACDSRFRFVLLATFVALGSALPVFAEFGDASDSPAPPAAAPEGAPAPASSGDAAPANSNLQREYARLAQLLNSTDVFGKREACSPIWYRPG
jgi:hypothetical protein